MALLANVSSKRSAGEVPEEIAEVDPASVALAEQEELIESVEEKESARPQELEETSAAERSRKVKESRAADREQMERNAMALKNKSDKSSGFSVGGLGDVYKRQDLIVL